MSFKHKDFFIRRATIDDMPAVAEMINELAVYHNSVRFPLKLEKDLQRDGFQREPAAFQCIVAEVQRQNKCSIVGYALYYPVYSTWRGKALLLEDLFVKAHERKREIGSYLFEAVVKEAHLAGYSRVDFHVAGWNSARSFYERKGAKNLTETMGVCHYRLTGAPLRAAAAAADHAHVIL
nr:diamine acetyltransferase 2-like [Danaus plexippus plexippus]